MSFYINARFLTQKITGVQRYALECSRQILKKRNDVTFLAPDAILYPDLASELNVKIIGTRKGHWWEQTNLPDFLKKNGHLPLLNLANTAPLLYNNNYITIHDLAFLRHPEWNTGLFSKWYRLLIPKVAKNAQHIFTVSHTIKNEIQDLLSIPPQKISVTYNGIASSFPPPSTSINKKKIVLAVGTFNPRKNHDKLIQAFIKSNLYQTYTLIIAGDKEKIYRQLSLTSSEDHIKIINSPNDKQLIQLYQDAEILISLSSYEGFGIPILEGLYFGCKALCSQIPVYQELYDNYVYFCNTANINNIIFSLNKITTAPFKNENNIDKLFEKYSYHHASQELLRIIH